MANFLDRNPQIKQIFELFFLSYNDMTSRFTPSRKKQLEKYVPTLFKKWYYSTLLEDTVFSPANIIGNLSLSSDSDICYGAALFPPQKERTGISGRDLKIYTYSIRRHPILRDLQKLTMYCTPDAPLDETEQLPEEMRLSLSLSLSNADPFYLEYLTYLAFKLHLLIKMPALYTKRVQASASSSAFFRQETNICLKKIVSASLSLSSEMLAVHLDIPLHCFSPKRLKYFLVNYQILDYIFYDIYHSLGLPEEMLFLVMQEKEIAEEDSHLLSSAFYIGILLDKWFFSIFGSYLKLIEPIYFTPFSFETNLQAIQSPASALFEPDMDLFYPCTCYHLTQLGDFLLNDSIKSANPFAFEQKGEYSHLLKNLQNISAKENGKIPFPSPKTIFTLKIKWENNKRYWKTIEIQAEDTLLLLAKTIQEYFAILPAENCHFDFISQSGFFLYMPYENMSEISLSSFLSHEGETFFFHNSQNQNGLEIELTSILSVMQNKQYPCLVKQSKLAAKNSTHKL